MSATRPTRVQRAGLLLLGLVLSVLLVEGFFRVWARTAGALPGAVPVAGDYRVVLCIGDSHTWGRGHGYPERIARQLARRSDDFRVVNLGVPGSNTAQLRARLPGWMDRYDPELIVVWSGVNNSWNSARAELREEPRRSFGEWLSEHSRIVRFFRVWRHQRGLRELFAERDAYVAPETSREPETTTHERVLGDDAEAWVNEGGTPVANTETTAATREDLIHIVRYARDRGVPVILISYGLPAGAYGDASRGIREAGVATGAPVVEATAVAERLLARMGAPGTPLAPLYDATVHPRQVLYEAVGNEVLRVADALALLPPTAP